MRWNGLLRRVGLAILVASSACDTPTEPTCPGDPTCPPDTTVNPWVVDGINLNVLFDEPSRSEILQVRREMSGRPPSVIAVETVTTFDLGNRETVRVVAGLDADGDTAFVGAIRVPPRNVGDQRVRPLMVVLPHGPNVEVSQAIRVPPLRSNLEGEFVTVVMGYRGQQLRVAGRTFTSDLTAEPYDRDADDVLALVEHARANAGSDRSDPDRVVVTGWGRGGGVALLATAHGLDVDVVLSLGATTNFFLFDVKSDARRYLRGDPVSGLPELEDVLKVSVGAVQEGTLTLDKARLELLKRSPAFFVSLPPYLIAVHGERDRVVPVEHGRSLNLISGTGGLYIEREELAHESVLTNGEVISVVSGQICSRILSNEPVCSG